MTLKKVGVWAGVMLLFLSNIILTTEGNTSGSLDENPVQESNEADNLTASSEPLLTPEETMDIQILVSACINASSGTMEEYLVDQNMLESDDEEDEFEKQTQFILSVYNNAYVDEAKKCLAKVVEKIDDDEMFLTQKQLYTLLEMAGAKPSKDLASYDYLAQWYKDGYYKIPKFHGMGETYRKIDFGKTERKEDGKVWVNATLQLEPDYGAVETFRFILAPDPDSIFHYTVESVRAELVQPNGAGIIGTDTLLQKPYESPTQMSDNPFDYIFELDGVLYQMPFPVGELEGHGWEIVEGGNLGAGERKKVHAKKGNVVLTLGLWNYNTDTSELKDCQVVWVKTGQDKSWNAVNFKLAEGVESGMKKADVEPLYHNYLGVYTSYSRTDALYKNVCGYNLHFDNDVIDGFEMGYAPTPVDRQQRIRLMTGSWAQDPKTTPTPGEDFEMEMNHVYLVDIDGDGTKDEICVKTIDGIQWAGYTCLFINGEMNYVVNGQASDQVYSTSMKMVVENGQYYFIFEGGDYGNNVCRKVRLEKGWSKEVAFDSN